MTKPEDDMQRRPEERTDKQRSFSGATRDEDFPTLRIAGQGIYETYRLDPGKELIIGRALDADIRVDDSSISRRHARLRTGPPISIEDLGSVNGTRVGGRPLGQGDVAALPPGEVIEIGGTMLVIIPSGAADEAQRRPPPREPFPTLPVDEGGAAAPVVVRAPAMVELYKLVDRVAASSISVLLLGETGVGKEVVADAIHRRSPRADKPMLTLNCAALSDTLLESELFGYEKGAFTGAAQAKPGLLETADQGTVFLDETGELPMSLQVKLLRVLEERRVMRVGGLRAREIDVRFIAATNRDLELEIERGAFRRDLYFRLNGISIFIPPLRERTAEIPDLAAAFLAMMSARLGRATPLRLSPSALARLRAHAWPGNVRELRNVVERAAVLCPGSEITPEHLFLERPAGGAPASSSLGAPASSHAPLPSAAATPGALSSSAPPPSSGAHGAPSGPPTARSGPPAAPSGPPAALRSDVEAVERRRILDALERCAWNQTQAARLLGISRGTLLARIDQFGLPRPRLRKSAE